MRTMLALCFVLATVSCSGCKPEQRGSSKPPLTIEVTSIMFNKKSGGQWVYVLTVHQWFDHNYDGLAQEATFTNDIGGDHRFLEFFRRGGYDWLEDGHTGLVGSRRVMKLYAADAVGLGAADPLVLPANMDGSFTTQEPFRLLMVPDGIRGTLTRVAPKSVEWVIDSTDGKNLTVTVNGEVVASYSVPAN